MSVTFWSDILSAYVCNIYTQPDRTLFFLIFAYLGSFRNYGSNAAIYNFFKPETNKGEFSLYFELFEKKVVGGATLRNLKNKH